MILGFEVCGYGDWVLENVFDFGGEEAYSRGGGERVCF